MKEPTIELDALCLVPRPRDVHNLDGISELCQDARLVTDSVLPLQRKTMRSILAAAGIRVVANKKKFVIDIRVVPAEEIEMSDVPEERREEFYELEILNNVVTVRTPSQIGALWGTHTLGWIYRAGGRGEFITNLRIRDWSSGRAPGLIVDHLRGADYMLLSDWEQFMDRASLFKLKHVAMRMFGRSDEGTAVNGDLMTVPIGEEDASLNPCKKRRWYSVGNNEWQVDEMLPAITEDDGWKDLVVFANERGMTLAPLMDAYGRYSSVPRLRPELSRLAENGEPTGDAFCLSNPQGREFLAGFCAGMLERYYEDGPHPFHLDASNPDFATRCYCEKCKDADPAAIRGDHVEWFTRMLLKIGVPEVYVWDGNQAAVHLADATCQAKAFSTVDEAAEEGGAVEWERVFAHLSDYDPIDFQGLARFGAVMWCEPGSAAVDVSPESVAEIFVRGGRGEEFLAAMNSLSKAAGIIAETAGINLYSCRSSRGGPMRVDEIMTCLGRSDDPDEALDDAADLASRMADAVEDLIEEDERGATAEVLKTLVALGNMGLHLCEMGQALTAEDFGGAKDTLKDAIRSAQEHAPRWFEYVFVDEFSQLIGELDKRID